MFSAFRSRLLGTLNLSRACRGNRHLVVGSVCVVAACCFVLSPASADESHCKTTKKDDCPITGDGQVFTACDEDPECVDGSSVSKQPDKIVEDKCMEGDRAACKKL